MLWRPLVILVFRPALLSGLRDCHIDADSRCWDRKWLNQVQGRSSRLKSRWKRVAAFKGELQALHAIGSDLELQAGISCDMAW